MPIRTLAGLVGCVWAAALCAAGPCAAEEASVEANRTGNEALALIQDGRTEEGLAQLREAVRMSPEAPDWHMNLGSLLFSVGSGRFQSGDQAGAAPMLEESRKELTEAIALFGHDADTGVLRSQCHYLLGDLARYVFLDVQEARLRYRQALEAYPEHGGAREALAELDRTETQSKNSTAAQ